MFTQPSFGGSTPFGQPQQQPASGLFGQSNQPFSSFGQQPQQQPSTLGGTSFGTNTFGQPQQTGTGLLGASSTFGQQPQTSSIFTGFSQTQQKPATSFSGFGQPQQGTSTFTGFGQPQQQPGTSSFTTAFGQQPQQQQTSSSIFPPFGQTQPSTSTFGGGFGQTASQPATTFSGFGQPQQQQQPQTTISGFGTTQQQPTSTFSGFGQTQQQAPSTFGGFGTSFAQPQQQQPATSFSFATQPTATTTSAFSFNAPFGGTSTTSQPGPQVGVAQPFTFPPKTQTTAAPFSFSTQPGGQQSSFFQPQQQTQQPFSFQTLQQQQPFQFQQQAQQQPQTQTQQAEQHSQAFYQSIFQCHKFGDERDGILASLNFLQAGWGRGKGHYSQTFPPVTYTPANPFYRFKAVSYAFIQTENNEDGFVALSIKKSEEKVRQEEANLITALQNILGRPNIFFKVSGIKRKDDNSTTVNLFAEDRTTLRRVPATDLTTVLMQPHLKPHLDNLLIEGVQAKIRPSPEQLKRYLEDAPAGLDPRVWKQAQEDNPDPETMIPVPIIGIDELKKRAAQQESESRQHMIRLNLIEEDVTTLQNRHTTMKAELQQLKRKESELSHRLLKVILRQEVTRKDGTTIQPEEEELNKMLTALEEKLLTPAEFRGKLNELLSRARLKNEEVGMRYSLDENTLSRIKKFLQIQQESIQSIAATVRDDINDLKATHDSLNELALSSTSSRQPNASNSFEL